MRAGYVLYRALVIIVKFLISLRALLFVAHGVGEHMGRYNELIEVLIQSGILVFGHDQSKTMTFLL